MIQVRNVHQLKFGRIDQAVDLFRQLPQAAGHSEIRLHGMTYAAFVRSPHPHARIRSVDTAEALKLPGVVAVLTGKDLVEMCTGFRREMVGQFGR